MTKSAPFVGLLSLVAVVASCSSEGTGQSSNSGNVQQTIVSISESGIEYADLGKEDALAWGPPGVFSVKDGYAVPDNLRGVIVIFDESFSLVRGISFRGNAPAIVAVAQYGDDVLALDSTSIVPKILRIGGDGQVRSYAVTVTFDTPPSGLVADSSGIVLEFGGGDKLYRVVDHGNSFQYVATDGYVWNSQVYSVDKPGATYTHSRTIRFGGKSATISVPDHLGGVQVLGPDGKGGVTLIVDNVKIGSTVTVDQSLVDVDATGNVQSSARIPLESRLVAVQHGVALSGGGQPVVIVPMKEGLSFQRPTLGDPGAFLHAHANLLPNEVASANRSASNGESVGTVSQSLVVSPPCLTSAQMQSNALEYINNAVGISATSISNDSTCGGSSRWIPEYLGGPGTYLSVSYNWNGFDSPTQFNSFMGQNKKAGNWNTVDLTSCAKGVDCSGFVSRVWGFTYKLSTSTIPNHVKPYTPTLTLGDVLDKVGDHVVVFVSNATNGINTYESTHYLNYDKGVYIYRPWSTLTGYVAYRSETSCLP